MENIRYDLRSEEQKIKDLKQNNDFRLKTIIRKPFIVLKKLNKIKLLVVIPLKEIELLEFNKEGVLPSSTIERLKKNKLIKEKEDIIGFSHSGDLNHIHYESLVYKFPKRKNDVKNKILDDFYRDYSKSLKKQKDLMVYINTCPDALTSWRSVIRTINSKYGIILIINNNENTI